MQIIKKRLKNSLSNNIFKNQLTSYTLFYIIINQSQTITSTFRKKKLTKILFNKNFSLLKNSSFIYPICYISANTYNDLLKVHKQLQQHKDFKKIAICNIKANFFVVKNLSLLKNIHVENSNIIFIKFFLLLNNMLFNFIFLNKQKKE